MTPEQAIFFLNQIKEKKSNINVRIVIPFEDIEDCFEETIAHPVLEKTAWNDREINFLELKSIYK